MAVNCYHTDNYNKQTHKHRYVSFFSPQISSHAFILAPSSSALSKTICPHHLQTKLRHLTDWSPEKSVDFFLLFCFPASSFSGSPRGSSSTQCAENQVEKPQVWYTTLTLKDRRQPTYTHTDRGSWKTKGSYGDKPFPLFSNYQQFNSVLRLITSRPGMTFGNGWGGPIERCTLLLLLLLSVLRAAH